MLSDSSDKIPETQPSGDQPSLETAAESLPLGDTGGNPVDDAAEATGIPAPNGVGNCCLGAQRLVRDVDNRHSSLRQLKPLSGPSLESFPRSKTPMLGHRIGLRSSWIGATLLRMNSAGWDRYSPTWLRPTAASDYPYESAEDSGQWPAWPEGLTSSDKSPGAGVPARPSSAATPHRSVARPFRQRIGLASNSGLGTTRQRTNHISGIKPILHRPTSKPDRGLNQTAVQRHGQTKGRPITNARKWQPRETGSVELGTEFLNGPSREASVAGTLQLRSLLKSQQARADGTSPRQIVNVALVGLPAARGGEAGRDPAQLSGPDGTAKVIAEPGNASSVRPVSRLINRLRKKLIGRSGAPSPATTSPTKPGQPWAEVARQDDVGFLDSSLRGQNQPGATAPPVAKLTRRRQWEDSSQQRLLASRESESNIHQQNRSSSLNVIGPRISPPPLYQNMGTTPYEPSESSSTGSLGNFPLSNIYTPSPSRTQDHVAKVDSVQSASGAAPAESRQKRQSQISRASAMVSRSLNRMVGAAIKSHFIPPRKIDSVAREPESGIDQPQLHGIESYAAPPGAGSTQRLVKHYRGGSSNSPLQESPLPSDEDRPSVPDLPGSPGQASAGSATHSHGARLERLNGAKSGESHPIAADLTLRRVQGLSGASETTFGELRPEFKSAANSPQPANQSSLGESVRERYRQPNASPNGQTVFRVARPDQKSRYHGQAIGAGNRIQREKQQQSPTATRARIAAFSAKAPVLAQAPRSIPTTVEEISLRQRSQSQSGNSGAPGAGPAYRHPAVGRFREAAKSALGRVRSLSAPDAGTGRGVGNVTRKFVANLGRLAILRSRDSSVQSRADYPVDTSAKASRSPLRPVTHLASPEGTTGELQLRHANFDRSSRSPISGRGKGIWSSTSREAGERPEVVEPEPRPSSSRNVKPSAGRTGEASLFNCVGDKLPTTARNVTPGVQLLTRTGQPPADVSRREWSGATVNQRPIFSVTPPGSKLGWAIKSSPSGGLPHKINPAKESVIETPAIASESDSSGPAYPAGLPRTSPVYRSAQEASQGDHIRDAESTRQGTGLGRVWRPPFDWHGRERQRSPGPENYGGPVQSLASIERQSRSSSPAFPMPKGTRVANQFITGQRVMSTSLSRKTTLARLQLARSPNEDELLNDAHVDPMVTFMQSEESPSKKREMTLSLPNRRRQDPAQMPAVDIAQRHSLGPVHLPQYYLALARALPDGAPAHRTAGTVSRLAIGSSEGITSNGRVLMMQSDVTEVPIEQAEAPAEVSKKFDSAEVEFLAARVYTYIKRRLVIERERHGHASFSLKS